MANVTAYDVYQDGDEPKLVTSAVLFLDLLGTVSARDPSEAARHLRITIDALRRARDWGDSDPGDASAVVSWFSDNLGMAYPITDIDTEDTGLNGLLLDAGAHQLSLILDGFVVRGAVSLDLFYADPHLLYGPALNRAVELEKTRAIYPRIVLDEAAARTARRHIIDFYGGGLHAPQREQLAVDGEGVTFVNYLGGGLEFDEEQTPLSLRYLGQHRDFIIEKLVAFDGEPRVHDKYRWLAAYHDWFVSTFKDGSLADQIDGLSVRASRPMNVVFREFGHDIAPPEE